jgi:hypothetical protein
MRVFEPQTHKRANGNPRVLICNGRTTNKLRLDWSKHFDKYTKELTIGTHCLLVIDGYESHDFLEFQQSCQDNKVITICMHRHSSHLLRPLNMGCFAPLNKA